MKKMNDDWLPETSTVCGVLLCAGGLALLWGFPIVASLTSDNIKDIEYDTHYIFEKDGKTYIIRQCDGQQVSFVPISQTVIQDNELVTLQQDVLKVLNANNDEYYYSFDDIKKYYGEEIDEAYEEQLINNGAKVLKR